MGERGTEDWEFADDGTAATASALRGRLAGGPAEHWLHSSLGRRLAVVSNGERAMVVLLDGPGDPGEHATDPDADAEEWSDGFVLANGQADSYPDQDTVPLERAVAVAAHLLAHGAPPPDAPWSVDR
ncbi:Imm1 family immunity protein [Kitasatospora sp. NPDC057198]|uniref:Imm1 family immunity protein n=1 Tax=Kitasatospora sp. NPDC057198 TaxID=3346046 RepID=UPI00363F8411